MNVHTYGEENGATECATTQRCARKDSSSTGVYTSWHWEWRRVLPGGRWRVLPGASCDLG
jgi:hypothetical protein